MSGFVIGAGTFGAFLTCATVGALAVSFWPRSDESVAGTVFLLIVTCAFFGALIGAALATIIEGGTR